MHAVWRYQQQPTPRKKKVGWRQADREALKVLGKSLAEASREAKLKKFFSVCLEGGVG